MPVRGQPYTQRHLVFGWVSLLCFLSIGIFLEILHAYKAGWYLDPGFQTRRLLWTLGHAHGTLLALVHIGFGFTVYVLCDGPARWKQVVSPCLMGASILLPGGFLLGGLFIYDGDPGWGVFLVPLGAILLLVGVFVTMWTVVKWAGQNGGNSSGDALDLAAEAGAATGDSNEQA